jgi:hypothetical protein
MAAITGATVASSVEEVINSEYIGRRILEIEREPVLAEMLGWVVDASGTNSNTYTFPKWAAVTQALTEASGVAETDEIAAQEQTMTEVTVSGVIVGNRRALGDQTVQDSIPNQVERAIVANSAEIKNQFDTDLFLNITSASNITTYAGTALDITKMGASIATWRALMPTNMNGAIVLSYAQVEDLRASVRASGSAIFAGLFGDRAADGLMDGTSVGLVSNNYEGFSLYQTGNVPTTGADSNGCIMSAGEGGALGAAVWWGLKHEAQREATRVMTDLVTSTRYGTGLVNQAGIVEVVSLAT